VTSEKLRNRLREIRDNLDKNHAVRLHRAISWLKCAESYSEQDDDLSFIAAWVSFNACYGIDSVSTDRSERTDFQAFVEKLCSHDAENKIQGLLWSKYSQYVRLLIENQFVFAPFWTSVRANFEVDWETPFKQSKKLAFHALANNDGPLLLNIILDRLYVLRNQILHGGATYQSQLNRSQVVDGKRLLLELIPIIIELMFQEDDWGAVYFPVIEE